MSPFAAPEEEALARLFGALGLEWEYEPREFILEVNDAGQTKTAFRPDFFLPGLNLYVEVTMQAKQTKKNRKMRLLAETYPDVRVVLLGRRELSLFA